MNIVKGTTHVLNRSMQFLGFLFSLVPRQLPVGMTAFERLVDRVYGLADNICIRDDARYVLAAAITHLGQNTAVKADRYFLTLLRAAAAKQVAAAVFQEIRQKQAEALAQQQAEAIQKQAEATAQPQAASDVVPQETKQA